MRRRTLLPALTLAALASCGPTNWGWVEPAVVSNDLRPDYRPFAPASIRIYPLTHLGLDDNDDPAIICHIELRDRWGDSVKALGMLQVQLYQPRGGLDAETARQILKWDAALQNERTNAALYDPATQTYRLTLGGLPPWIAERAAGAEREPVRLELRAVFQTLGPNGEERILRDAMALEI